MSADHATMIVARALERWPGISARDRLPVSVLVNENPGACGEIDRAAEFLLARTCAAGDCLAMQAFEAEFFAEVRACHARIRPHTLELDELEQRVREKLFVKGAISSYSGKGDLRRWLRVLTSRLIFDQMRLHRTEISLEDRLVPDLQARGADATIAKAQLRTEIRAALHQAFAVLTDRQKLLLRSECRGTPLPAIARSYQVHVRSIQRWVREAHEVFLAEFRRVLAQRLRVAAGELSSVLTFARSQLLSGLGDLVRDGALSAARSA